VVTRRFGELDHTELVQLLDTLEGDQNKARFRESIYISVIFYLLLAWLIVYGPKYIFHAGTIVPSAKEVKEKEQLSQLSLQNDLAKLKTTPKPPPPALNQKTLQRLQAMQRASEEARASREAAPPEPAPAAQQAPAPAQTAPTVAQTQPPPPPPLPSAPTPQPPRPAPAPSNSSTPNSAIPDAPHPNAPSQPSPSIADAGRAIGQGRPNLGGAITGGGSRVGQQGAGTGVEILSDVQGVDFTDYIKHLLRMVKAAWLPLIPEECYPPLNKEGWTLIRFTIGKNGQLMDPMTLDNSSHDRAIDKAAWGAITGVGVFPPLPAAYKGDNLQLRIQFVISRNAPSDGY
jgi:outer membrane biosynthesis protein TonB